MGAPEGAVSASGGLAGEDVQAGGGAVGDDPFVAVDPHRHLTRGRVDTAHEQEENRDLRALSQIGEGPATIVRLAEHDGDLLHWFYDQGLVPGTSLEVTRVDPSAGQMTLRIDGDERVIADRAAAGLFVLPGQAA